MKIIFLLPGPIYNIKSSQISIFLNKMSTFSSGYIFTTSDSAIDDKIGNYNFFSCRYKSGFLGFIKYFIFCIKNVILLKCNSSQADIIVTYDPIKTGIIGVFFKLFLDLKLIVEVNGVYDSPFVWEDADRHDACVIKKYFVAKLIRFVLIRADGIKLLFDDQIKKYNINLGDKIVSTYFCFVNVEMFHSLDNEKEVLFVGFPFKIKGVDILIDAFKLIASNHPDWRLKILGWYPDLTELEKAINRHPQIYHHPPVPDFEMPNHIGKCGFLVQPSRTEAMGRVLLEAMAAGKARIGSNVGGIPTVINNGVDGFLVEVENVQDLADKMELLIRNETLRDKLGNAGAFRAKNEFSGQAYVRLTSEFYHRVSEM